MSSPIYPLWSLPSSSWLPACVRYSAIMVLAKYHPIIYGWSCLRYLKPILLPQLALWPHYSMKMDVKEYEKFRWNHFYGTNDDSDTYCWVNDLCFLLQGGFYASNWNTLGRFHRDVHLCDFPTFHRQPYSAHSLLCAGDHPLWYLFDCWHATNHWRKGFL